MKFGRLNYLFDGDSDILTDSICEILEGKEGDKEAKECREFIDQYIDKIGPSNFKGEDSLEGYVNALINSYSAIYFTAGYIVGQNFDVTDPEAVKEIEFLKKKLRTVIPIWPREKKAPERPCREESGAPSRQ
jgi:hypothetical protein